MILVALDALLEAALIIVPLAGLLWLTLEVPK
jgi:hypothetical protein